MSEKDNKKAAPKVDSEGKIYDVESGPRIHKWSAVIEEECPEKTTSTNERKDNTEEKPLEKQSTFTKLLTFCTVCWSFAALIVDFVLDGMLYTGMNKNGCAALPSPMATGSNGRAAMLNINLVKYLTIAKMPLDAIVFLERSWSLRKAMAGGGGILAIASRQSLRDENKLVTRRCPKALNLLFFCILLMSMLDFFKSFVILVGNGNITLTTTAIASAGFGWITAQCNITWVLTWSRFASNYPKFRTAVTVAVFAVTTSITGFIFIRDSYVKYQNTLSFYHVRPIMDVVVCVNSERQYSWDLPPFEALPLSIAEPISFAFTRKTSDHSDWVSIPSSIVAPRVCGNSSVIIPAQTRFYTRECENYPCLTAPVTFDRWKLYTGWDVVQEGRSLPWGLTGFYNNTTASLANATDGVLTIHGLNCPTWATYTRVNPTFDPTVPSSLTAEGLKSYWVTGSDVRSEALKPDRDNFELCGIKPKLIGLNDAVYPIPRSQSYTKDPGYHYSIRGSITNSWQSHSVNCGPPWPCFMNFKSVANATLSTTNPLMVPAGPNDPGTLDSNPDALNSLAFEANRNQVVRYVEWRMEIIDAITCG